MTDPEISAFLAKFSNDDVVLNLLDISVGRVLSKNARGLGSTDLHELNDAVSHVTDWLTAAVISDARWLANVDVHGRPKKLLKFSTLVGIAKEADKAMKIEAQKLALVRLSEGDEELFEQLDGGMSLVRLLTPASMRLESATMQHCIGNGSYDARLKTHIYLSLRDRLGKAHATMEIRSADNMLLQLRGKQNKAPVKKYYDFVRPFLVKGNYRTKIPISEVGYLTDKFGNNHVIEDLPDGLEIDDNLYLQRTSISTLPDNLHVSGFLGIGDIKSKKLGKGLRVDGELSLSGSNINQLPDDLLTFFSISIHDSNVETLNAGSIINGELHLDHLQFLKLPGDVNLNGDVKISGEHTSRIDPYWENLVIRGNLDVSNSNHPVLPSGLIVEGSLIVASTECLNLPKDIQIGKNIVVVDNEIKLPHIDLPFSGKVPVIKDCDDRIRLSIQKFANSAQVAALLLATFERFITVDNVSWKSKVSPRDQWCHIIIFGQKDMVDVANWFDEQIKDHAQWLDDLDERGIPKMLSDLTSADQILEIMNAQYVEARNLPRQIDSSSEIPFRQLRDGWQLIELTTIQAIRRNLHLLQTKSMLDFIESNRFGSRVSANHVTDGLKVVALRDPSGRTYANIVLDISTKTVVELNGRDGCRPDLNAILIMRPFFLEGWRAWNKGYVQGTLGFVNSADGSLHMIESMPEGITIEGNVDLDGYEIESIPANLRVIGDLTLESAKIGKIGDGLSVSGKLLLDKSSLQTLPNGLKAGGLSICNTVISRIPDGSDIADLWASRSALNSIPASLSQRDYGDGMMRYGSLALAGSKIVDLPNKLHCGTLIVAQCELKRLPEDLNVYGFCNLERSSITKLPENMVVWGDLMIGKTSITKLPNGLQAGSLTVSNYQQITEIGEDIVLQLVQLPIGSKVKSMKFSDFKKRVEEGWAETSEVGEAA